MIDLHERLSEFSYGYGVTREVEGLLGSVGMRTAPFLPSLLHEGKVGFDVGFKKPGSVLLIQFKLGQLLRRFLRTDKNEPAPKLRRPFWRFTLNTAEPEGQYETLLKAEQDGAEAYYVAPRFVDWSEYLAIFESGKVLEQSVMLRPSEVRDALVKKGANDGWHRIVYDLDSIHVCSTPVRITEVNPRDLVSIVSERVTTGSQSLAETLRQIFSGLENRRLVRRERRTDPDEPEDMPSHFEPRDHIDMRAERTIRLSALRSRARSEEDAIAAAVGIEAWSLGIQLILATPDSA